MSFLLSSWCFLLRLVLSCLVYNLILSASLPFLCPAVLSCQLLFVFFSLVLSYLVLSCLVADLVLPFLSWLVSSRLVLAVLPRLVLSFIISPCLIFAHIQVHSWHNVSCHLELCTKWGKTKMLGNSKRCNSPSHCLVFASVFLSRCLSASLPFPKHRYWNTASWSMYRVLIIILSSQVLEALDKMSQEHLTTDYSRNKTGNLPSPASESMMLSAASKQFTLSIPGFQLLPKNGK